MFACIIFFQAEMEQGQLSELLMQMNHLNKLEVMKNKLQLP